MSTWWGETFTVKGDITSLVVDYSLIVARNFSVKFKISLVKLRPWQSSVRLSGAKMAQKIQNVMNEDVRAGHSKTL